VTLSVLRLPLTDDGKSLAAIAAAARWQAKSYCESLPSGAKAVPPRSESAPSALSREGTQASGSRQLYDQGPALLRQDRPFGLET